MPLDVDALAEELYEDEGERLKVYDDATGKPLHPGMTLIGHPSIGRGRALDTNGISRDESIMMERNDIVSKSEELYALLPWLANLDDARQRVFIKMAFQMGVHGLVAFHDTLSAAAAGDYAKAADCMLESEWGKETPARAKRMSQRMRTGIA
jgi:lysozyme